MKIKTSYQNIYAVLKMNRFIVLASAVCAFGSSLFFGFMVYDMHQKSLNSSFAVNTDGSVIPLKWVAQKENLYVEALAHQELFHTYFYGLDASNYEKNLNKALYLGDSSVDNLYRQKKADGVYNRLLQYSLVEKIVSIESQVDLENNPYAFQTTTIFEINRGTIVDTYELVTTGNLITVDRHFPNNTHGLLITNFFEKSLKKLNNEN